MADREGSIWNEDLKSSKVEKGPGPLHCIVFACLCKGQRKNEESDTDVTEQAGLAESKAMLQDKGKWRRWL